MEQRCYSICMTGASISLLEGLDTPQCQYQFGQDHFRPGLSSSISGYHLERLIVTRIRTYWAKKEGKEQR